MRTDERVDTSDLDLLDDGHRHARCTFCGPVVQELFQPFEALCGRRAVYRDDSVGPTEVPSNACPECLTLWDKPCRRCGN